MKQIEPLAANLPGDTDPYLAAKIDELVAAVNELTEDLIDLAEGLKNEEDICRTCGRPLCVCGSTT